MPDSVVVPDSVVLIDSETNTGPAGGYHLGIERALDMGATWLWLMDDDIDVPHRCLEDLLTLGVAGGVEPQMLWPTQVNPAGETENYPGWYAVLVSRSAVLLGGLPRADLVWWIEDTEYLQWRLPRSGVVERRAPHVRVVHGDARPDARRPAWKTYYETRNTVWYRTRVRRPGRPDKLLRTLAVLLIQSARGADRCRRLVAFSKGLIDGIAGRLGPRWPLPLPKR
uniref:Unannotated protein n=1 Tax=freshwater metagenome TaxID=449393 RepID=A0A6J7P4B8_9ZZZZ